MPIIANCVNEAWLDHFTGKGRSGADNQPERDESPPAAPNDDYRVPRPRSPEGEKSAALRRIGS